MIVIPKSGLAAYIQSLAAKHNVVYGRTTTDQFAETITQLSGDEVVLDEMAMCNLRLESA